MIEHHNHLDGTGNGTKNDSEPLGCDPETGMCLVPESTEARGQESAAATSIGEIVYFTDPYCSWCWATEPVLFRLLEAYRGSLHVRYVMGGLVKDMADFYDGLNDIRATAQVAPHWRDVSQRSGQPIDERLMEDITDPHFSTWPACIAIKAAQFQGEQLGERFLRRVRRAALTERRMISDREVQTSLVREVPGLDAARWLEDLESGKAAYAFKEDLAECRRNGVTGFPTMLFRAPANLGSPQAEPPSIVNGHRAFATYDQILKRLAPEMKERPPRELVELLLHHGPLTTRELSEIRRQGPDETRREMETLARLGKVRELRVKGGELWEAVLPH